VDLDTRITQFKSLIESDPNNDMAYFSLGNALLQAERHLEAAKAFVQCTEINKGMTKAFQLAGRAFIDAGETEQAKEILSWGYIEAVTRGDMLPKKAIEEMLVEIDAPIPEVVQTGETSAAPAGGNGGDFRCTKTGLMGHKMARPPFKNGVGTWIQDSISKETFMEWIKMGTKVINELRLDLSRDDHDAAYDYAMRLYLGLDDALYASLMDGKSPPMPDGQFKGVIDDIMAMGGHLESEQGNLHTRVE
tara:strand:+ start:46234 stop:46977 length:744 start_codon:yes stop_codon:yes gene_type:complete